MTMEALDSSDEGEKEKFEEVTTEFEQLTEWRKGVFGAKLQSTSKEMVDIGDKSRVRTIGHADERSLQPM